MDQITRVVGSMADEDPLEEIRVGVYPNNRLTLQVFGDIGDETVLADPHDHVVRFAQESVQVIPVHGRPTPLVGYRREDRSANNLDKTNVGQPARYKSEIEAMVWDRRSYDKVAPLIRWARATTADMDPEDRESWLRSVLPPGLIGEHAISHLRFTGDNKPILPRRFEDLLFFPPAPRPLIAPVEMADRPRRLDETGGHAHLNRTIADRVPGTWDDEASSYVPPRKLLGLHDVDAFTADVLRCRGGMNSWRVIRLRARSPQPHGHELHEVVLSILDVPDERR